MMPTCSWVREAVGMRLIAAFRCPGLSHSNLDIMKRFPLPEQFSLLPHVGRWILLSGLVGALAGSASAFFLWALDIATDTRIAHPWLVWFLPVAGFCVGLVYLQIGTSVEGGNNLLIDEIHDPRKIVPKRMAPLVLVATVITHLFGGSAGREGTAVQMGGALADQVTHRFNLGREDRRILLMGGIAAGFSSVFGTPLAGAIFGLEVLAIGRLRYDALLSCFMASIAADLITRSWGIRHTVYAIPFIPHVGLITLGSTVLAGIVFGVAGMLFADATHGLSALIKRRVSYPPMRPLIGGSVVALASLLPGTSPFLGLGIPTIVAAFHEPLPFFDAIGKFGFTVVTLASGFKGGEVTPLFYIGATLGNALSHVLALPFPVLAGLGFVAVFAGAANTPIASTMMAIELFGVDIGVYAGVACVVAYLFSGHTGIYRAQRVEHSKHTVVPHGIRLSELAAWRNRRKLDVPTPSKLD